MEPPPFLSSHRALPQECFSSGPPFSPPCVDALSTGCVLHVKQAADAVRRESEEAKEGLQEVVGMLPGEGGACVWGG